jgi:hypothetical protein
MPIIKKHQNIVDFTAQQAGSVEALFSVSVLNGISITGDVEPGTNLKTAAPLNNKVVADLIKYEVDIVSDPIMEATIQGGIGFMQIGNDFIVS